MVGRGVCEGHLQVWPALAAARCGGGQKVSNGAPRLRAPARPRSVQPHQGHGHAGTQGGTPFSPTRGQKPKEIAMSRKEEHWPKSAKSLAFAFGRKAIVPKRARAPTRDDHVHTTTTPRLTLSPPLSTKEKKKNRRATVFPPLSSLPKVTMALPPLVLLPLVLLCTMITIHAFVVGPAQPFDATAVAAGPTSRAQRCRLTRLASASPNNDFYGRSFQRKSKDHPLPLPLPDHCNATHRPFSSPPPPKPKKLWARRRQNPRVT